MLRSIGKQSGESMESVRAFKIYDGYCCSWHCCGLLKLIHIASRQARHNKTVLSVSRGVNWIPDNSRLSVAEDSKAEHVQSHRPIHTRHDTDRTVLSCLAGSVNWALQAYSSTPVVTRASVADTRCMNVFYHVLELLFFTFFPVMLHETVTSRPTAGPRPGPRFRSGDPSGLETLTSPYFLTFINV